MPLTDEQVAAAITAIQSALARGELTVEYQDRRVTYRSVDELRNALDYFEVLSADASGTRRPKQSFAVASKGF